MVFDPIKNHKLVTGEEKKSKKHKKDKKHKKKSSSKKIIGVVEERKGSDGNSADGDNSSSEDSPQNDKGNHECQDLSLHHKSSHYSMNSDDTDSVDMWKRMLSGTGILYNPSCHQVC